LYGNNIRKSTTQFNTITIMKKQVLSSIVTGCVFFACQVAFAQPFTNTVHNRGCAAMEYKAAEEQHDPSVVARRAQIEKDVQEYIKNQQTAKQTPGVHTVYTIPIVFHIVYNAPAENVSDACITATVKAFNDD